MNGSFPARFSGSHFSFGLHTAIRGNYERELSKENYFNNENDPLLCISPIYLNSSLTLKHMEPITGPDGMNNQTA